MSFSKTYVQLKQLPLRYAIAAAAFLLFILLILASRHSGHLATDSFTFKPASATHDTHDDGLMNDVFNATLGVWPFPYLCFGLIVLLILMYLKVREDFGC